MSDLTLGDVKAFLDVIHSEDDAKLQLLLAAAEDEAMQIMDRLDLVAWGPSACCGEPVSEAVSEIAMPSSVRLAILILVQAAYQASPADQQELRRIAEIKLWPYRCSVGV